MSKKRRVFDIDIPTMDEMEVGKVPDRALRRGPVAEPPGVQRRLPE